MQKGSNNNPISQIFLMLTATIYWCKMVTAAPWAIESVSSTLPIQSAEATGYCSPFTNPNSS
jgi:hypothetical protein